MVINLPLLATISCQKTETKVLINKKGALLSQNLFDANIDINSAKGLINNQWILDNKNKLFENPELLTTTENITNVKTTISGTTIIVSFVVDNQSFEFTILNFRNPDFEEVRLSIKNNTVFDKTSFNELKDKQEISEAIKLIDENWLRTNKDTIFNNSHLITNSTSVTVNSGINGTFITIQATIGGIENFNFFIQGFTNSVISGNNKETIVKSPLISDESFKDEWAHSESYSEENVKSFVENNKDKIFHNLPIPTTLKSVTSTYNKIQEGIIDVKVTLSGKIYNQNGELIEANNKEFSIQLIGFKTTGLTTTLKVKEFSVKDIEGLKDKKASEIKNENESNNITNNSTLKSKIKELVENSFLGKTIEDGDIEITIIKENSANDAKGTLDVKVKVKDKAWANGVKEEKEFELKLVGFKIQAPTEISNFEIKNLKKDILSKHYAIPYGKWNDNPTSTQEESETDEQTNEGFLKIELSKYVKSLFNNEHDDTEIKDVKINKNYSIGSIQNGYDAAHGAVYIVVTLNKYYDENGILVDNSTTQNSSNEGKFYFKVTGFKVDDKMTTRLDYEKLYDDKIWNAINLREDSTSQTKNVDGKKISTIKASEWNKDENLEKIKEVIIDKLLLGNEIYSSSPIINKVYGDEQWEGKETETFSDEESYSIEIDKTQNAIFDDVKGTLILEVTFKNIWWINGVFFKEHKERIRFSGFNSWENDDDFRLDKIAYNPSLEIVEEEIKKRDGSVTKEKVAVISNPKFGDVDFIDYLLFDFYEANINEINQILKDDYQYTIEGEGDINLIPDEGLEVGTEVLKKIVQDVLGASIKFSILKTLGAYEVEQQSTQQKSITTELEFLLGMNYTDYLAGLEKFQVSQTTRDLETLKTKIKVTNINWNENVGDTFNFTIEIEDNPAAGAKNQNVQKFNFKLIGFLGANNTKIESPIQNLTTEVVPGVGVNSNNNISRKDWFDMKWTTHQYSNSEGIKNPQFYGHYWYSLDITINNNELKDEVSERDVNKKIFEIIKNNKLSDFYLIFEGTNAIAYDIVENKEQETITVKFKHETWSSIDLLIDNYKRDVIHSDEDNKEFYLAISNLGSFDFHQIFVKEDGRLDDKGKVSPDWDKFPDGTHSKSIFAAEFVKDNYDQYGAIKLKGYDLPIDIDQYQFWYQLENGSFQELDKTNANIVQTHYSTKLNKNVFVKIQFSLEEAKKLPENAKLYVSLKDDQNNKHLINI